MASDLVKRVSVFSTGRVRIRPEHVGPTWKNTYFWLFTSRRWTEPRPINVYVIEHRSGVVLFDTGQDRASVTDVDYFPKGIIGFLYSRLARFQIAESETLQKGLAGLGLSGSDIHSAVISHLHQDHIGGLSELQSANIVLAEPELQSLSNPMPALRGLMRNHIELPGLRWKPVTMEPLNDPTLTPFTHGHDLFNDGSLVVLPTPGHTPGSVSLLVRGQGTPLLMVGDLTYDDDLLQKGHLPGVGEKRQMRESAERVNLLRDHLPGLVVLPAHDPRAAQRLAGALAPLTSSAR
ncbi:MAG: N-acyl homoserine lactonase family protein [Homoserinimonas sp.]